MESHSFRILEEKVKQAIGCIDALQMEKDELRSRLTSVEQNTNIGEVSVNSDLYNTIKEKVDNMLGVLEGI